MAENKIFKIYNMELGAEYNMHLMVVGMTDKGKSSKGDPYVTVELFDGEKKVPVNFFDCTLEKLAAAGIQNESILDVMLKKVPGKSEGQFYYNQSAYRLCQDPAYTKEDFVHAAPINPDQSFEKILSRIKEVDSNPDNIGPYKSLSHLALKLLTENADAFKRSSAAVSMHHNFLSGLLYHTERMVDLADQFCKVYPDLDKELLICGTALHDIGKISCYATTNVGESSVTVEGRLLDHALVGILMVHDAIGDDLYNPEKIQMLKHMIASHHGKKEWDAITTPAFPEATILNIIDLADSRINMYEEAYKGQECGTVSEEKVFGLENSYIYKPIYPFV